MRPARIIIAATLAAIAIAAGSYLALSTNTHHPAAAADTAPTSPVVQTPTTTGDPTNPEPAVLADGRHPVLLKTIDPSQGTVTFDLIQYFHGDQATIEAAKDHQESPPPNDSYSRNVNPRLRTLPVRADAAITANQLAGSNQDIPVSLARLATLTRAGSGMFWITVRGDQVVRISQQWSP
jgi:hypothetical protein